MERTRNDASSSPSTAPESVSMAYFKYPAHQSLCLCVLLGNGSINTFLWKRIHAIIEKLLDVSVCLHPIIAR
jgi:hypothetical protein